MIAYTLLFKITVPTSALWLLCKQEVPLCLSLVPTTWVFFLISWGGEGHVFSEKYLAVNNCGCLM